VEWLISAGTAFALVAPVELPDKTFVATLVLSTRFRPLPVWLGVAAAFAVQCSIAVAAGGLLGLLPERPVRLVAAALFATGAVILWRSARRADPLEREEGEFAEQLGGRVPADAAGAATPRPTPTWRAAGTSFVLLFTAEWGDLSQLLIAGLVAAGEPPVAVLAGAWVALVTVSGAAVLLGRWLLRRIRLTVIRYLAAAVCATIAALTLASALA
jgi:putative Ca2+/H+ antiporter (TMEM165/GDT1 family)